MVGLLFKVKANEAVTMERSITCPVLDVDEAYKEGRFKSSADLKTIIAEDMENWPKGNGLISGNLMKKEYLFLI